MECIDLHLDIPYLGISAFVDQIDISLEPSDFIQEKSGHFLDNMHAYLFLKKPMFLEAREDAQVLWKIENLIGSLSLQEGVLAVDTEGYFIHKNLKIMTA